MTIVKTLAACAAAAFMAAATPAAAQTKDPIKVGFSMTLTGNTAPAGQQVLLALEIWRDDVNAKGGLLGRPVELVYYDDQGSPANEMDPSSGRSRPPSARSTVVFPEPEGPKRTVTRSRSSGQRARAAIAGPRGKRRTTSRLSARSIGRTACAGARRRG